ncbi:MAG TPA: GlsB/YeaQ/YmgE family stress response membrane protein [Methylomirabilota bacterium]|nr:GlsB/YeaQ/YmgE family stress response membrane protein [Methylomirabilota bacterium]
MAIITTIIIGLIVGLIAKFLMPGKDPGGFIVTTIIGIAGAFLGTFAGRALGMYQAGESAGWIMSIVGAILLLFIYRLFTRRAPPA